MIINPTSVSFESIRSDLITYISNMPDSRRWKDFFAGSAGTILVELLAGFATYLSFQVIVARREIYLQPAELRSSNLAMAETLGYSAFRGRNYHINLTVTPTASVLIKKFDNVGSLGDYSFYAAEDTTLTLGVTTSIEVIYGTLNTATLTINTSLPSIFRFIDEGVSDDILLYLKGTATDNYISLPITTQFKGLLDNNYLVFSNNIGSVDVIYLNSGYYFVESLISIILNSSKTLTLSTPYGTSSISVTQGVYLPEDLVMIIQTSINNSSVLTGNQTYFTCTYNKSNSCFIISITATDSWGLNHSYRINDAVLYEGKSYVCKVSHTSTDTTIPTNITYWKEIAITLNYLSSSLASHLGFSDSITMNQVITSDTPILDRILGNSKLTITTNYGTSVIVVPNGTYTGPDLAAAIQSELNNNLTLTYNNTSSFTVLYDASNRYFTIEIDLGTVAFVVSGTNNTFALTIGFTNDKAASTSIKSNISAAVMSGFNNTGVPGGYNYKPGDTLRLDYIKYVVLDSLPEWTKSVFDYGTVSSASINTHGALETIESLKINAPLNHEVQSMVRGRNDYKKLLYGLIPDVVDTNTIDDTTQDNPFAIVNVTYIKRDKSYLTDSERESAITALDNYRPFGIPLPRAQYSTTLNKFVEGGIEPGIVDPENIPIIFNIIIKLLDTSISDTDLVQLLSSTLDKYNNVLGTTLSIDSLENAIETMMINGSFIVRVARITVASVNGETPFDPTADIELTWKQYASITFSKTVI